MFDERKTDLTATIHKSDIHSIMMTLQIFVIHEQSYSAVMIVVMRGLMMNYDFLAELHQHTITWTHVMDN